MTAKTRLAALLAVGLWLSANPCQAQIKSPGAHPAYGVELEPHVVLQWGSAAYRGWYAGGSGLGLGLRATIPFLDNGPVSSINNNMGIGFGLDWAHYGGACYWYYGSRPPTNVVTNCSTNDFWLPVVLQWNFFITRVFSAYAEPGLAIRYTRWTGPYYPPSGLYAETTSEARPELILGLGGRVHASERISFTFRIGWPYLSLGASFFL